MHNEKECERRQAILHKMALRFAKCARSPATPKNRAKFDRALATLHKAVERYAMWLPQP